MGRVTENYSANEPGDGCLAAILIASIVLIIIFVCVYALPLLWKIEPTPVPAECPTHSCMYDKP